MGMENPSADVIEEVLIRVFPAACRIVGSENLHDLCEGRLAFEDDMEALHMDVAETLSLLANAVTVIAFVWQLWNSRRAKAARATADQIDLQVIAEISESAKIPRDKRVAIYVAITTKAPDGPR